MEDLSGEDNEEALFVENSRGKSTSDNSFRYKIYWYNNFSISIVTQNSLNIDLIIRRPTAMMIINQKTF